MGKSIATTAVMLIVATLGCTAAVMDNDKMLHAYLAGDMKTWGTEIKRATGGKLTTEEKLEVLNYLYGYVPSIVEIKDMRGEAEFYIDMTEEFIEEVEKTGIAPTLCNIYRVSMYAAQISLNSWEMMTLGPKCLKLTNRALEAAPEHPLALGLKGNTLFYAPGMFGGNKREALEFYLKSMDAFKREANPLYKWNEAGMMYCIAEAYEKVEGREKAIEYCREVLTVYPDYAIVKKMLERLENE